MKDSLGRVIDFSVIKETLCQWLEDNWDHKMLLWEQDPVTQLLDCCDALSSEQEQAIGIVRNSIVKVPFNPTAENMGEYLISIVAPRLLEDTSVRLSHIRVEETRKCAAEVEIVH